jgi:tetratricopeptide (TPR) repeat protein
MADGQPRKPEKHHPPLWFIYIAVFAIFLIQGLLGSLNKTSQIPYSQFEAYFYRGNAHAAKREIELAIADYDAALRLKPDFAQAFYNRAFLKTLLRRAAAQARLGFP